MSVDYSPLPEELIGEMEREGTNWLIALSEVIDNAFDANANRVVITARKGLVEVFDDGDGCEQIGSMLRKGFTTKHGRRKQLGRYGIGLKHASFYACGLTGNTEIASVHGGKVRSIRTNWGTMVEAGSWLGDDPVENEATPEICHALGLQDTRGTLIRFRGGKRQWPTGKTLEPILEDLAFTFAPALENSRQIIVLSGERRHLLTCPQPPKWTESIDRTIPFRDKSARIRAGILESEAPSRRRGLSYFFLHRVIEAATAHGCGEYPVSHISGSVELQGQWKLGQNKRSVSDEDWSALGDMVLQELRPLLEKASQKTWSLSSSKLRTDIEDMIYETIGKARRKGKANKSGTITPRNTPRTVKRASVVSGDGRVIGPRLTKAGKINVEFVNQPEEQIVHVDIEGERVYVNQHFAFIRRIQATENRDALCSLVVSAFLQARVAAGSAQKTLPSMANVELEKQFTTGMTDILGSIAEVQCTAQAVAS